MATEKSKDGVGKLLKDIGLTAILFTPGGRAIRVASAAAKGMRIKKEIKVAKAAKYVADKEHFAATKNAVAAKAEMVSAKKTVAAAEKHELIASEHLKLAKLRQTASGVQKIKRLKSTKYITQEERGVTSTVRTGPIAAARLTRQGGKPARKRAVTPTEPRPIGLKTTTGQHRVRVSDIDAKDVSKELRKRPNSERTRNLPRPGALTTNEKARIKVRQPVITSSVWPRGKSPMTGKKEANIVRINKLLKSPPKRKPILGPLTAAEDRARNPKLPSHKVNVGIPNLLWRIKKEIKVAKAEARLPGRKVKVGENKHGKPIYMDAAEYIQTRVGMKLAAKNPENWSPSQSRTKFTIEEGRGGVPQPKSITRRKPTVEEHKNQVAERNRQRKAHQGGPSMIQRTKPKPFIKRDASGKPIRKGNLIVNAEEERRGWGNLIINAEEARKVFPRAANTSRKARKQTAKIVEHRAIKAIKEIEARELAARKAEYASAQQSLRAGDRSLARMKRNAKNKPKFSRNVTTGRLTAKRPIKTTKKKG